jgi:hypothetical protein
MESQHVNMVHTKLHTRAKDILYEIWDGAYTFNMVLRVVFENTPYILGLTLSNTTQDETFQKVKVSCNGVIFALHLYYSYTHIKEIKIFRKSWSPPEYDVLVERPPAEVYFYLPELLAFMLSGPETTITIRITDTHTNSVSYPVSETPYILSYEVEKSILPLLATGVSEYENKDYRYAHRPYRDNPLLPPIDMPYSSISRKYRNSRRLLNDDTFTKIIEQMRAVPLSTLFGLPAGGDTVGNFADADLNEDSRAIADMFWKIIPAGAHSTYLREIAVYPSFGGISFGTKRVKRVQTGTEAKRVKHVETSTAANQIFDITKLVARVVEWATDALGGDEALRYLYKTRAAGDDTLGSFLAFGDVDILN